MLKLKYSPADKINFKFVLRWLILLALVLFVFWRFKHEMLLISKTQPSAWTTDHRADCGIVLTGGPGRVKEGFDLLAQGMIKKLIVSGVNPSVGIRDIFPNWPYYGNLNELDVILEKRSGTTYGNAQQTLPLVEALHCRQIVLITSVLHMYRARKTFVAAYPDNYQILPRAIVAGSLHPDRWDLSTEAFKSLFYSLWAY